MATLDDIRVLQKRARDKEYRLRKQGADQASISQVSPRQDWGRVKSMTKSQLNAYAHRLNNFNKRGQYVGSASGDVIPKRFLTQANKLITKYNKFVTREAARIQGIAPDLWEQYRVTQKGVLKNDGIGGLLTPIDVKKMEPPRSLDVAKRRVKSFQKRAKRDFNYYRKIQRKNMIAQMNQLQLYDLSELVRSMSSEQFDVLSSVLPTWDRLTPEYYTPGGPDSIYSDIRSYVYKAWSLGLKKSSEAEVAARFDAPEAFAARNARGRNRALQAHQQRSKGK